MHDYLFDGGLIDCRKMIIVAYLFVIFQGYILEVCRTDLLFVDDGLILLEIHMNYSIAFVLLLVLLERTS